MSLVVETFDLPEKVWRFLDGSTRSVLVLKSVTVGRGEYQPGWRWSAYIAGRDSQSTSRVGYVLSGRMTVRTSEGAEVTVGPGDAFEVGPGHDVWVVGDEPCVVLDFTRSS